MNDSVLVITPTQGEMEALSGMPGLDLCDRLVCGVGPGATAFRLTRALEQARPGLVLLAGVAGAYPEAGVQVGGACIATSEAYGDLGRCDGEAITPIELAGDEIPLVFPLGQTKLQTGTDPAALLALPSGPFVTVSCTSGSRTRAQALAARFTAMAENMEGAAAAQVCSFYGIPLLEIRGISNEAGDVDKRNWRLLEAMEAARAAVSRLLPALGGN